VEEGGQRVGGLQEQLQASREDVRAAEELQVCPVVVKGGASFHLTLIRFRIGND
jgi:hypothetical protein